MCEINQDSILMQEHELLMAALTGLNGFMLIKWQKEALNLLKLLLNERFASAFALFVR